MPWLIKGLQEHGIFVRDYYKLGKTYIPREGGLALLFACGLMITLFPLFIYLTRQLINIFDIEWLKETYLIEFNYYIILAIMTFGLFGMMDDYINVGRPLKIILPIFFTIPLVLAIRPAVLELPIFGKVNADTALIGIITVSVIYRFAIIPLYIVVSSNLVNMHSGFNGLATGTSSIILITLLAKSLYVGGTSNIIALGAITGATVALWWYNKYPAQIFEGNAGALMIGASIGALIIIPHGDGSNVFLISGFIMFIPHTINFLMYFYWRVKKITSPDDPRYRTVKFGKLRKDGTLKVPNNLTLKWVLPYKYRMTEKQAVLAMYGLTILFCVIGFFMPW
jgi:UDP-N-acetylglucosamine--dolichyl-phosphate N-acetylglucosaminephosphotransferase